MKIYIMTEQWEIDSGAKGLITTAFSSFEKAKEEYLKTIERYKIDYNMADMVGKTFEENIEDDYINAVFYSENSCDDFEIVVESKEIQ